MSDPTPPPPLTGVRLQGIPAPTPGQPQTSQLLTAKEAHELLRAAEWMADGRAKADPLHKACRKLRATMRLEPL